MDDATGPPTTPCFKPSKSTENFSRLCQLIMTICSDLFRNILSHYIKPTELRLKLDSNRTKLEKIMNAQQKEQIYPNFGTTTLTSRDLDISVLYILLRNICNIPKHRNGWGNPPIDADSSLAACIEQIRIQRNLISGHSPSGVMDDTVFQDHWDKLKKSILEIEKQLIGGDMYERGINELLTCDLNPSRSEKCAKEIQLIQDRLDKIEEQQLSTNNYMTENPHRCEETMKISPIQKHGTDNGNNTLNELHDACRKADIELSRSVIRKYPNLLYSLDDNGWNAALHAAQGGNVDILQLLANNGVDVQHQNYCGWNILHVACVHSNLEMCRYIIQTYPDLLHSVDNGGWNSALHAARGGDIAVLKLLSENKVDVKLKDFNEWNILHVACILSNVEMSHYIIQTHPDLLHSVDNGGWNAALHAARGGNVEILKLLAENEVDIKRENDNGWNILHVACVYSNLEISTYIVKKYPDLQHSVSNNGSSTALHASRGGNVKILQLLTDNAVDIKHENKDGWNILHAACLYSNFEMSRYIIQKYPDLLHSVDNDGWNAALHAAQGGNVKILQLLEDNAVNVKLKNKDGCNILHVASGYSNLEMSHHIVQTYPDLLNSVDDKGWNAAHNAAQGGNVKVLQLLAENEVDIKHKDNNGWNILDVACIHSNFEMSSYIIQTYPDLLHSVDNDGLDAALHAARGGNVKILQLLTEKETYIKNENRHGWNILHMAGMHSNLEMCRYIIQAYPDLLHSVDKDGWNAALHATRGKNAEILQLLANNGVNVKHKNNKGWNILHVACVNSNLEMIRYIIQTHADLIHNVDDDGWNAALHAAKRGNITILQELVDNEIDVKHFDNDGWNIFHVACCNSHLEMSSYIIQTYPDLLNSEDNDGWNAALHAARGGSVKVLQLLSDKGVDIKHKNIHGWNILHVACIHSNLEMSQYIIQTYPGLLHCVDNDGWNAAIHAARGGSVQILQLLEDKKVNVKHKSKHGWNILHVACIHSNLEMSQYIIQTYPGLLHGVDNDGWNAALHAARGGSIKLLQLLANSEVDVKHIDNDGWNILIVACRNSNFEMSRYIIQIYPELLHSVDNDGWNTALHAAKGGNVEILQLLADNDVNINHENN